LARRAFHRHTEKRGMTRAASFHTVSGFEPSRYWVAVRGAARGAGFGGEHSPDASPAAQKPALPRVAFIAKETICHASKSPSHPCSRTDRFSRNAIDRTTRISGRRSNCSSVAIQSDRTPFGRPLASRATMPEQPNLRHLEGAKGLLVPSLQLPTGVRWLSRVRLLLEVQREPKRLSSRSVVWPAQVTPHQATRCRGEIKVIRGRAPAPTGRAARASRRAASER
jgi:hypothetical protein